MKCEAEIHSGKCQGKGTTIDHFTPKSLARLDCLKWVYTRENYQHLDPHCHELKDRDTSLRAELRRRQQSGEFISLEEYIKVFSLTLEIDTRWDYKSLKAVLLKYQDSPEELAMILEELEFFF